MCECCKDTIDLSNAFGYGPLIVKFKKLDPYAVIPVQTDGNTGMDMVAIKVEHTDNYIEYSTGIAVEIPEGYAGLLFPRSSVSKTNLILSNGVGLVDPNFRGEIRFRFKNNRNTTKQRANIYGIGDRIGQLVILPYPKITSLEVTELSETTRGEGGFGSTGK